MRRVDYDGRLHQVYARGRAYGAAALQVWMEALGRHLPPERPLAVLDLGSGAGRFTPALADAFGGPVYGVEPSAGMRGEAEAGAGAAHPAVTYLAGRAEAIPLPDASCDLAFLFFVFHHIEDQPAAIAELRRVVGPAGSLFVRTAFGDRLGDLEFYDHFARARAIEEQMYASFDDVVALLRNGGFGDVTVEEVRFPLADSRRTWLDRLKLRAISTFEHMTEEEIAAGFESWERALADAPDSEPVYERAHLLVARA